MDVQLPGLRGVFKGVAGIVVLGTALSSFTMLDETERGIDYQFGEMVTQDEAQLRGQGLSFKAPWTSVKKVETGLQEQLYEGVATYTKDNQTITANLAVVFKMPKDRLVKIFKENPNWEGIMERTVLDSAKTALGQQEAQFIAQNREKIMVSVTNETNRQVKGLLGIEVVAVKMPNFDFDDAFESAVQKAANAKAVLDQKRTELEQQRVEKDKTIVGAEAEAEKTRLAAEADAFKQLKALQAQAEGNLAVAEAEAKGFEKIKASVGIENMQTYLLTNRWNGTVPTVSGSNGGTIVDLRSIAPAAVTPPPAPAR